MASQVMMCPHCQTRICYDCAICHRCEYSPTAETVITDRGLVGWKVLYNIGTQLISPIGVRDNKTSTTRGWWHKKYQWLPNKKMDASDHGIYSYKTEFLHRIFWEQLGKNGYPIGDIPTGTITEWCAVKIRIWGRIKVHQFGYKAQYATVEEVFLPSSSTIKDKTIYLWRIERVRALETIVQDLEGEAKDLVRICMTCGYLFCVSTIMVELARKQQKVSWPTVFPKYCRSCSDKLVQERKKELGLIKEDRKKATHIEKYLKAKEVKGEFV